MSEDEIEAARLRGIEDGKEKATQESNTKRLDRLEKGVLGVLFGGVYLWGQSKGLWP